MPGFPGVVIVPIVVVPDEVQGLTGADLDEAGAGRGTAVVQVRRG